MIRAGLVARVWRAEGTAGTAARIQDHLADGRRRARFRRAPLAELPSVDVLQICGSPPVPWLGGVSAQLGARLAAQGQLGATALLFPWRDRMRLEVTSEGQRLTAELPLCASPSPAPEDPAWGAAVREARRALRARLLHVEGAAGLPHSTLRELARELPLLLSLHDFALFCPQANLFDDRLGSVCDGCSDEPSCHTRLTESGRRDAASARGWRVRGGELLAASRCAVYASAFLMREHTRLFGGAGAGARVIAPGIDVPVLPPVPWPNGHPRERARIAFLGGGSRHKGAFLLASIVEEWNRSRLPPVEWEVFGGGGLEQLRELRRLPGIRVLGYYRHGSLPGLLRERNIDLCLFLPQFEETFSLTLSEVLAAGTPALALSSGALADRLGSGGGILLPPRASAPEVVETLRRWLAGAASPPPPAQVPPSSREAAAAFAGLHRELLAAS